MQSAEMPQAVQLTKSAPETYNLLEVFKRDQEVISGVNSVVRGDPSASLKSGAALAMVASQAVVYTSGLQESYVNLVEDIGTFLVQILQRFAKFPQLAEIVGKVNQSSIREFTGDDLSKIERVTVEVANAALRTAAGRAEMAKNLLDSGLLTHPEQYLQVLETGSIEPLTEAQTSELELIRKENELLREPVEGQAVVALVTDNPILHMKEHLPVLSDPLARTDAALIGRVSAHLQDHMEKWHQMPPSLLQVLNIPPPPPDMPMGPMGPMAGPEGQPGPGPSGGGPLPLQDNQNPMMTEAQAVKGPSMPSLPPGAPDNAKEAFNQLSQGA